MAIGIFDSGVGGLTVYKTISEHFPKADIHYLGDTARVPYGSRSQETVIKYSLQCAQFLVENFDIDTIIVACNTASSYAIDNIREKFGVNVIGVVEPGAKSAFMLSANRKIGIIGTRATIRSQSYVKALQALSPGISIQQTACPLFVPIVEEMLIETEIAENVVKHYLDELINKGVDTLILGCTHYPLLKGVISKIYPHVSIVDSSEAIIACIEELSVDTLQNGIREIYLTDESPAFETLKNVLAGGLASKKVTL
ncbi:MAG: glutamate racemase [Denitrovibrio sp.]|nr:MAG: glutamate racemase [Denitrovibrio sp.]